MARFVIEIENASEPGGGRFKIDDPVNPDYQAGRGLPSGLQGLLSSLQGITLGFGDELAGAAGAVGGGIANLVGEDDETTFGERYRRTRDLARGAQEQFMRDRPVLGTVTRLATGAPYAALGGGAGTAAALPIGVGRQSLEAAKVAAALGLIQGAGESEAQDLGGIALDAAKGAGASAAMAGGATAVMSGIGAVGGAVKRGLSKKSAQDFAKLKVAEALARDAPKNPVAIEDAAAALRELGPEARIADAAGESTRNLLDTMATLPGRTKTLAEDAIRARQAGRGGRIVTAADEALGTGGRGFMDELTDLAAAKKAESAPLYAQVSDVRVRLTKEVKDLLARIPRSAWRDTAVIVKAETGKDLNIGDLMKERSVPLSMLDSVKRGLYESAQGFKREGKGGVGMPLDEVRRALIDKLDEISPKDLAGKSIYKSARETYGGFANLEDLLNAGKTAMRDDVMDVAAMTKGLDASQLQAFRIGALQALKAKVGTESGQTSLLKFWKEPATQERLRVIFGDDKTFGKFVDALKREGTLKRLEGVGRGSQTAARLANMGDLDVNPVTVARDVARGNFLSPIMDIAGKAIGRVRTPEATRDEIGRILLSQGEEGGMTLNLLREYLDQVNAARLARARAAGAFAGVAPD